MDKVNKTYLTKLIKVVVSEEKADRCLRIARQKYDKPSAYRSGAIVRCRKGDIWKDIKEADDPQAGKAAPYGSGYAKVRQAVQELLKEDETLRKWFSRKGAKGKSKGWVDCNTCRKDPETGRKKCKSCGRKEGEKRADPL